MLEKFIARGVFAVSLKLRSGQHEQQNLEDLHKQPPAFAFHFIAVFYHSEHISIYRSFLRIESIIHIEEMCFIKNNNWIVQLDMAKYIVNK